MFSPAVADPTGTLATMLVLPLCLLLLYFLCLPFAVDVAPTAADAALLLVWSFPILNTAPAASAAAAVAVGFLAVATDSAARSSSGGRRDAPGTARHSPETQTDLPRILRGTYSLKSAVLASFLFFSTNSCVTKLSL